MPDAHTAGGQRRARWTSAAVLAPGAAALFGATVSWAAATTPSQPAATPPTTSTTTSNRAGADHAGLSAQARHWRAVAAQRTQLRHDLTHQLAAVQARIVRLHAADQRLAARLAAEAQAAAAAAAASGSVASSGGYVAPAPVVNQPVGPAPVVAPAPAYVPPAPVVVPAAPPPPVHAATGGSGHP